jgi:lipid II:glycine glycyltransferase (peptidoglycan interpeptide bridge formation enzyme)
MELRVDVRVRVKPADKLLVSRLIQQTRYWSRIKKSLGWTPVAYDLEADGSPAGDLLLLMKDLGGGQTMAYAPYGPEGLPDDERRGEYLVALSSELVPHLGPDCVMARWDLPWESPYARELDRYDEHGNWLGPPEPRLRELRMNWGVPETGLRKAPGDLLPPDTILVDLDANEDAILERMKPKTRYNIRLAGRRGVEVRRGSIRDLELWNTLYRETARRNQITPHGQHFFAPLLTSDHSKRLHPAQDMMVDGHQDDQLPQDLSDREEARLLIAEKNGVPLAAMFMSVSSDQASYLYGASSGEHRELMAPYALQWAAIQEARKVGCTSYDLFGVAPGPDPEHPMYGLYQFKRGFGGRLLHRQGAWDYPYDLEAYNHFRAAESVAPGFNV